MIEITHKGLSGEANLELEKMVFKFYDADKSTPLDDTEMGYFTAFELYHDDNDNDIWTDDGLADATGAQASPEIVFNIDDADADFAVAQGITETYFFVVTVSALAPASFEFAVEFDTSGYGDSHFTEIENTANDKVVRIEGHDPVFAGPVSMPEFHLFVLPFLALFLGFVVFLKRKRIYS
jgi:hypothetical protein